MLEGDALRIFLKDYVLPYWKHILVLTVFVIMQVYLQMMVLSETHSILNSGVAAQDMGYIERAGIKMLALTLLYGASIVVVSYLSAYLSASVTCDVRRDLFRRIMSFSQKDFSRFGGSTLMTRLTADTTRIQIFMLNALRNALLVPVAIVAIIIATAMINAVLCALLVTAFAVTITFMVVRSRQSMPMFNEVQEELDGLNTLVREKAEGARTIRAFGRQRYETERFAELNEEYREDSKNAALKICYLTPLALLVMNLVVLLMYYIGSVELQERIIGISDMILFFQYVTYFISCLAIVPFIVTTLPKTIVSTARLEEVLSYEPSVVNDPKGIPAAGDTDSDIVFDGVSFGYAGAAKDAVSDVTVRVGRGMTTAIIGPTGSGKSTLVQMIPRFFDPTSGTVMYRGADIRDMDVRELRSRVAYASQRTMVMADTVYANIAMGTDVTREEAEEACRLTLFSEVLDRMPDGLDTKMSRGGMNVSGGQKQRLSLARTICKDADIYVFDDCFSALDANTERTVRRNIMERLRGKTVVMVAQKINTIRDADSIVVMDKGRVVMQGTHEELLESCGLYREIYETQSYGEGE